MQKSYFLAFRQHKNKVYFYRDNKIAKEEKVFKIDKKGCIKNHSERSKKNLGKSFENDSKKKRKKICPKKKRVIPRSPNLGFGKHRVFFFNIFFFDYFFTFFLHFFYFMKCIILKPIFMHTKSTSLSSQKSFNIW